MTRGQQCDRKSNKTILRKNGVVNRKINLIYYNILKISRCIILIAMVINDIHSKLNIYICKPFESKITFQFNFQFTFISSSLTDNFLQWQPEYLSKWWQPPKSTYNLICSDYPFTFLLYVQSFTNICECSFQIRMNF